MRLWRVRLVSYAVHPGPRYGKRLPVVRTSVSGAQNLSGRSNLIRGTLPLLPSKYGGAAQFNFRAWFRKLWRPVVNVGAGLCARPKKPPLCKGRCHGYAVTEGLSLGVNPSVTLHRGALVRKLTAKSKFVGEIA